MIKKLLICLIVCYFIIVQIKTQQLAPQNCQSETGTENYDNFYVIKCGKTNGNELEINVYVDDPSEINILLAPRDDYNDNDKDNYEIVIVDGVPLLALGSEPEQMNEQAGSSGGNAEGGSPGSSPERITIQVQSFKTGGAIIVNILGKTYSYEIPEVVNVKYLSFADFTRKKNVFYFNCPDDCSDLSNSKDNAKSEKKKSLWQRLLQRILRWLKGLF